MRPGKGACRCCTGKRRINAVAVASAAHAGEKWAVLRSVRGYGKEIGFALLYGFAIFVHQGIYFPFALNGPAIARRSGAFHRPCEIPFARNIADPILQLRLARSHEIAASVALRDAHAIGAVDAIVNYTRLLLLRFFKRAGA